MKRTPTIYNELVTVKTLPFKLEDGEEVAGDWQDHLPELNLTTYTKHYYIGSERVASVLGTTDHLGLLCPLLFTTENIDPNAPAISNASHAMDTKTTTATESIANDYTAFEKEADLADPFLYDGQMSSCKFMIHDENLYQPFYFHPDHLGSSSYISNKDGYISQHMEYFPFGETLVEEHKNSNNSPYKFNGKELDDETGNYYYGARYYNPKWSFWLSVDPLAEKTMEPYSFVANNPLRYIDPDGRSKDDIIITGDNADLATQKLAEDSALSLSRNSETGKASISNMQDIDYNSLSSKDKRLYDIVTDGTKTVNLRATNDNFITLRNGEKGLLFVGAYDGQRQSGSISTGQESLAGEIEIPTYEGFQVINMNQIMSLENNNVEKASVNIFHEVAESYSAMEIVSSTPLLNPTRNVYDQAHSRAISNDSRFIETTPTIRIQNDVTPNVIWYHPNANADYSNAKGWFKLN